MSDPTIDRIMSGLTAQVKATMDAALRDTADDMRRIISVPVVRSGGKVIRSKPGEPPRKDTGKLLASVQSVVESLEKDKVRGSVSTNVFYDVFLTNGTSKMAPRPYAGPTEAKWERLIENRLAIATRQLQNT
jgi:hypothetical protein